MTPSDAEPSSPWFPPLSLLVIAIIVYLISLSPWRFDPIAVTGQAFLLIVGLRLFCYWAPMRRWVLGMPVIHRAVFALIVGGMILGHYTLNGRAYFPYIAWEIFPFVDERDPVTCQEFIATTRSGQKVRLLTEQLFPSIVQIYPLDDTKRFPPETLDHLARALAQTYNERHANDPVQRVDLVAMAVQLHPSASESRTQPSTELLQCYDISSGH